MSTSWSIVPPQYSEMLSGWKRDWAKLALGMLRQSHLSMALQVMARWTLALLTSLTVERGLKCKAAATARNTAKIQRKTSQRYRGTEQLHRPVPLAMSRAKPVTFFAACSCLASASSSQTPRRVQVPEMEAKEGDRVSRGKNASQECQSKRSTHL